MATSSRTAYCLLLTVCCLLVLFSGCARREQPLLKEAAIATPAPTSQPQDRAANEPIVLPPPNPSEVRKAIERVYRESVTVYAKSHKQFIVGDFNGDLSQDIAVVVKPGKGKLAKINSDLANWTIGDAQNVTTFVTKRLALPTPPAPVKVEPDDILLAVIHGYGAEGW